MGGAMKKRILICGCLLLCGLFLIAQGLNTNSSRIKSGYPIDYEQTIRKNAIEKWDTDYTMVIYEINQQSDALIDLIGIFRNEKSSLMIEAIKKWSTDGYENSNMEILKKLKNFSLNEIIKLNCDWSMVKYEYDNQVKAYGSLSEEDEEGLGSNAKEIKQINPSYFETTIKKNAESKWENDYQMIVYEINNQADALFELIDIFENENTSVFLKAIEKWSTRGKAQDNRVIMNAMKYFNVKELVQIDCDWTMVKYEYQQQVEAKKAF
jgi:hypothetical protein